MIYKNLKDSGLLRKNKLAEIESAVEKAKSLRQKEAYKILDKKANYMIGIGAKNITPKTTIFLIEIILIPKIR